MKATRIISTGLVIALLASSAFASKSTAWQPDPSKLSALAPATTIRKFSIQLPQMLGPIDGHLKSSGGATMGQLTGAMRSDKSQTSMVVMSRNDVKGAYSPKVLAGAVLDSAEAGIKGKYDHKVSVTPREYGTINGLYAVRERLRVSVPGRSPGSGFLYVVLSGKSLMIVGGLDFKPYDKQTIPIIEASALTMKLK